MTLKQYERITRDLRNHVFSFVGERKGELEKEISEYAKDRIESQTFSARDSLMSERSSSLKTFATNNSELEEYFLGLWKIYIGYFPTRARSEEYLYYRFSYQLSDRQKQLLLL